MGKIRYEIPVGARKVTRTSFREYTHLIVATGRNLASRLAWQKYSIETLERRLVEYRKSGVPTGGCYTPDSIADTEAALENARKPLEPEAPGLIEIGFAGSGRLAEKAAASARKTWDGVEVIEIRPEHKREIKARGKKEAT